MAYITAMLIFKFCFNIFRGGNPLLPWQRISNYVGVCQMGDLRVGSVQIRLKLNISGSGWDLCCVIGCTCLRVTFIAFACYLYARLAMLRFNAPAAPDLLNTQVPVIFEKCHLWVGLVYLPCCTAVERNNSVAVDEPARRYEVFTGIWCIIQVCIIMPWMVSLSMTFGLAGLKWCTDSEGQASRGGALHEPDLEEQFYHGHSKAAEPPNWSGQFKFGPALNLDRR